MLKFDLMPDANATRLMSPESAISFQGIRFLERT